MITHVHAIRALVVFSLMLARPAVAVCPIPFYITDANDLVQIKGKAYDNAGNETTVKCTLADAFGAYQAITGGASDPPSRNFQGINFACPELDYEAGDPFGPAGADVQIVKNGTLTNACAFVGQRDSGSGYPQGIYMSSVLKFDAGGNFKSEKGTLIYNLGSGSFIGKFKVVARP
jgi:hypothetical protein